MSVSQFVIQILLTSAAAFLGAFLTRRTERFKHLQELRSAAYADFLRGFAKAVRAQNVKLDERSSLGEFEGMEMVTGSRSRIAIYGGKDVVHALAEFIRLGTQTLNPEGMQAFAELVMKMRSETDMDATSFDDISRLLFS